MLGLDWCDLYNKYHDKKYNTSQMKDDVEKLHSKAKKADLPKEGFIQITRNDEHFLIAKRQQSANLD